MISNIQYILGATVLLCVTINPSNLWYWMFSIIGAWNHFFPGSMWRGNNIVKIPFTVIISKGWIPDPLIWIVMLMDCLALTPVQNMQNFEIVGGILPQGIILYAQFVMMIYGTIWIKFLVFCMIILQLIYFYERRVRIKNGDRENFGILHVCEHISVYCYLLITQSENYLLSLQYTAYLFLLLLILPGITFFIINMYIFANYLQRLQKHYSNFDQGLMSILHKKILKNCFSLHLYNYIIKPYSYKLSWEYMSWTKIDSIISKLCDKIINDSYYPDLIIGVASGGAFCVEKIVHQLNEKSSCHNKAIIKKPITCYVKAGFWSDKTTKEACEQAFSYVFDKEYLRNGKVEISMLALPEKDVLCDVSDVKNILVFDDTVSTGMTLYKVLEWTKQKFPLADVRSATLITPDGYNKYKIDYQASHGNVPMLWEWGVELD